MAYEMKFEIDEPQFTQREVLGVIDLPATTINTWIKRSLLEPFEFFRDFREWGQRFTEASAEDRDKIRTYKVFQHDPAVRRMRLYSILDTLFLAGIKAVLEANIEIRFAYKFPGLLSELWTDVQLINLNRQSLFESPVVIYVDDGSLYALYPPYTEPVHPGTIVTNRDNNPIDPKLDSLDLLSKMRDGQLTTVTVIDWPAVEEGVIDGLKRIIGVRGHRDWDKGTK
jgi:hypothetical protein